MQSPFMRKINCYHILISWLNLAVKLILQTLIVLILDQANILIAEKLEQTLKLLNKQQLIFFNRSCKTF